MSAKELFDTLVRPSELDSASPRFVKTPWGSFALYGGAADFTCAEAFCPHMEGPLFEGTVDDGHVTCPWHRWRFRLDTGERIGEASDPTETADRSLKICRAFVGDNGTIHVEAPE